MQALYAHARIVSPTNSQVSGDNINTFKMKSVSEDKSSKFSSYKILVDNEMLEFHQARVTGLEILMTASKIPQECFALYQKLKGGDFEHISLDEIVDLSNPGIEKFVVKPSEVFHYKLDDEPETTEMQSLTANQILENGGITPVSDYYLIEIDSEGHEIRHFDNPEEPIKMRCPGSKFVSVFRGETPVS